MTHGGRLRAFALATTLCLFGHAVVAQTSVPAEADHSAFHQAVWDDAEPLRLTPVAAYLRNCETASVSSRIAGQVASDDAVRSHCRDLVQPAWLGSVEYLNWKPRQRGLDFAVSEDGQALTVGEGQIHEVDLDRDPGLRVSLGYLTNTGWAVNFRYTDFETSGQATALRPPGVGELFATRSHPDTNEEANVAVATAGFDYRSFDVEALRSIYSNSFSDIFIFGGVRFTEIDQRLQIDYDGRDFVDGVVATRQTMDGFGFRVGSEGYWRMAAGFSLFGRLAGSLMRGRFDSSLFESNLGGVERITDVHDDYDQAVPVLEMAGGLAWERRWFSVAAGYELTDFFSVGNRAQFVDDIHEGLYGPFETDVLLEGLFVRLTASR